MAHPWLSYAFLVSSAGLVVWTLATRRMFPGRSHAVRGVAGALICLANAFIFGLSGALPTFLAGTAPVVILIAGVATGVVGWRLGRAEAAGKLKAGEQSGVPGRCPAGLVRRLLRGGRDGF